MARLFEGAGYRLSFPDRSYYPTIDDDEIECVLIRAQEIARYVEQGVLDAGITGKDMIVDNGSQVEEIADLKYSKTSFRPVRWVVAVPEDSEIEKVEDLQGKRIATEAVGLTEKWLRERGLEAQVEFSWGATEVKPPLLADAIVEVTETGSSLRANHLRIVETLMQSTPRLIANSDAYRDAWKRRKVDRLALLLTGAINAQGRVGLMMNVPADKLDDVMRLLPALASPTVSHLADETMLAITTVLEETVVRELIPDLCELGATGLVEFPLSKIVF